MKKFYILIIFSFLLIIGCSSDPTKKLERQTKRELRQAEYVNRNSSKTKVIAAKEAPIENNFSGIDFFFGNGSITKSQTVYYFIAVDGALVSVDLKTYASKKIGDTYSSTNWK